MLLKKVQGQAVAGGDTEEISVTVEPKNGHSDAEVIRSLNNIGASEVEVLAPGYISAQVNQRSLNSLTNIAHVRAKPLKQMHNRYKLSW